MKAKGFQRHLMRAAQCGNAARFILASRLHLAKARHDYPQAVAMRQKLGTIPCKPLAYSKSSKRFPASRCDAAKAIHDYPQIVAIRQHLKIFSRKLFRYGKSLKFFPASFCDIAKLRNFFPQTFATSQNSEIFSRRLLRHRKTPNFFLANFCDMAKARNFFPQTFAIWQKLEIISRKLLRHRKAPKSFLADFCDIAKPRNYFSQAFATSQKLEIISRKLLRFVIVPKGHVGGIRQYIIPLIALFVMIFAARDAAGQADSIVAKDNVFAKSFVTDAQAIKLRWAPANTKAWVDGKKYGYTVERYTVMVDKVWQDRPSQLTVGSKFIPQPVEDWAEYIRLSDYAAVIAQAFYGEDFSLTSNINSDIGSIINEANELEQRFATSVFMAEYDYRAAQMAGWAWTDTTARAGEKYLYRIYLNRPDREAGDTAVVFTGTDEKRELPRPIGLGAIFGDRSAMLSWNYALLSSVYHSYHIERKAADETEFRRITELPVSALSEGMTEIMYADSLADNQSLYSYRIYGLTGFDEKGPLSDTISGHGKMPSTCIPYIINGSFTAKDLAVIYWEFDCEQSEHVDRFQLWRSGNPETDFSMLLDNIPLSARELAVGLTEQQNYVKLIALYKDSTQTESFPMLLRQTDSIPPAIPRGLKVVIDTLCVAHLSWEANTEPDLRGYRILRGFTQSEEKSSILSDFIPVNQYADTLSLDLANANVYYSLTALDVRYNESLPSETVAALKPNRITPDEPVFTGYETDEGKVKLSWMTNPAQADVQYALLRQTEGKEDRAVIFTADYSASSFTDEPGESGTYSYIVVATAASGKQSTSPQPVIVSLNVTKEQDAVGGFGSYADRRNNYIELYWRKKSAEGIYRIYKATDKGGLSLWKELPSSTSRITDEHVGIDTEYTYTIVFVSTEGRASQSKTLTLKF
jgi:fibronectin type 3 domain-containing protein